MPTDGSAPLAPAAPTLQRPDTTPPVPHPTGETPKPGPKEPIHPGNAPEPGNPIHEADLAPDGSHYGVDGLPDKLPEPTPPSRT